MCLAVPGMIERIDTDPTGVTMGVVSFAGIRKHVCLAYVEDAQPGQYVIVHAGFAIATVDEAEARRTLELLAEIATADDADASREGAGRDALRRRVP